MQICLRISLFLLLSAVTHNVFAMEASLLDFPLKDWSNPGKSGSIFLVSQDGHFMPKSLNIEDNEPNIVKRILPAYTEHLIANRQSLLARYLGLYSIQPINKPNEIVWLIAMRNVLSQHRADGVAEPCFDYRFDLKGYYDYDRKTDAVELAKPDPTFMDWEFNGPENKEAIFPNGIELLDEGTYKSMADMLNKDITLLYKSLDVADFSLFVAVHFNDAEETKEAAKITAMHNDVDGPPHQHRLRRMANGGIPASCVDCKLPKRMAHSAGNGSSNGSNGKRHSISVFVGIVDLLMANAWNFQRRVLMIQRCYIDRECLESQQVLVHPAKYAARFQCFANGDVFHVENAEKRKKYTEEYCADFNKCNGISNGHPKMRSALLANQLIGAIKLNVLPGIGSEASWREERIDEEESDQNQLGINLCSWDELFKFFSSVYKKVYRNLL